jgi:hypothetical protein
MRHLAVHRPNFLTHFLFCSHFPPLFLFWTQAANLSASFNWSIRPGDAMRPLSVFLIGPKASKKRSAPVIEYGP